MTILEKLIDAAGRRNHPNTRDFVDSKMLKELDKAIMDKSIFYLARADYPFNPSGSGSMAEIVALLRMGELLLVKPYLEFPDVRTMEFAEECFQRAHTVCSRLSVLLLGKDCPKEIPQLIEFSVNTRMFMFSTKLGNIPLTRGFCNLDVYMVVPKEGNIDIQLDVHIKSYTAKMITFLQNAQ